VKIRSIKPDFWKSETVAGLPFEARLFFIGLWNLADDYGRFRAHPKIVRGELLPFDDDAPVDRWLEQIADAGLIVLYEVDGTRYGWVRGFSEHQKIDRRAASRLPEPSPQHLVGHADHEPTPADDPADPAGNVAEPADSPGDPAEVRALDTETEMEMEVVPARGAGRAETAREPRRRDASEGTTRAAAPPRPPDVPESVWNDWVALRKAKRAKVSLTALQGLRREAAKAGMSLAAALEHAVTQGWQGFRADWVDRGKAASASHAPQQTRHIESLDLGDPKCSCLSCRAVRRDRGQGPAAAGVVA